MTSKLALSFINLDTCGEAVMWFNVDICGKRGWNRGKQYRTGAGGKFIPPRSRISKLKRFWLRIVRKPNYMAYSKEILLFFKFKVFI